MTYDCDTYLQHSSSRRARPARPMVEGYANAQHVRLVLSDPHRLSDPEYTNAWQSRMSDPAYANVHFDGLTDAASYSMLETRQTTMHGDVLNLAQRLERVEAVPEVVAEKRGSLGLG